MSEPKQYHGASAMSSFKKRGQVKTDRPSIAIKGSAAQADDAAKAPESKQIPSISIGDRKNGLPPENAGKRLLATALMGSTKSTSKHALPHGQQIARQASEEGELCSSSALQSQFQDDVDPSLSTSPNTSSQNTEHMNVNVLQGNVQVNGREHRVQGPLLANAEPGPSSLPFSQKPKSDHDTSSDQPSSQSPHRMDRSNHASHESSYSDSRKSPEAASERSREKRKATDDGHEYRSHRKRSSRWDDSQPSQNRINDNQQHPSFDGALHNDSQSPPKRHSSSSLKKEYRRASTSGKSVQDSPSARHAPSSPARSRTDANNKEVTMPDHGDESYWSEKEGEQKRFERDSSNRDSDRTNARGRYRTEGSDQLDLNANSQRGRRRRESSPTLHDRNSSGPVESALTNSQKSGYDRSKISFAFPHKPAESYSQSRGPPSSSSSQRLTKVNIPLPSASRRRSLSPVPVQKLEPPKRLPEPQPAKDKNRAWRAPNMRLTKLRLTYKSTHKDDPDPLSKRFYGCSDLESNYTQADKLGEGTFGVVWKGAVKPNPSRTQLYRCPDWWQERCGGDATKTASGLGQTKVKLPKDGQLVAVKKIILHKEEDGTPITSIREIKVLKMLDHVNIVSLLDMAVDGGDPVAQKRSSLSMVFPYMEHDLVGLLENPEVKLDIPLIKLYSLQLFRGINYLHQHNMIHRDIKAANILVNNQGLLQIADFGLVRSIHPASAKISNPNYTREVVTRWYRPPEVLLSNRNYGSAVDMWGIGCVLGEMFTKHPLFPGASDVDQAVRIFRLCGSPTSTSMPDWNELPGVYSTKDNQGRPVDARNNWDYTERSVRSHFVEMTNMESFADLMDGLLLLNHRTRWSAVKCLDSPWFYEEPFPYIVGESSIPTFRDSHEFDRTKRQQAQHMLATRATDTSSKPGSINPSNSRLPPHLQQSHSRPSSGIPTSTLSVPHPHPPRAPVILQGEHKSSGRRAAPPGFLKLKKTA